ncbi:glutamine transport ATP-binding protein GlnQ [Candidatus Kuenenia stuttgartiensis]|jgi:ABC-type polar amino acid transport system ATPase subunit|uniref:Glutamine transport ATP-binding protein GlnQ n=2 Tax=Kuenenia stuttgartiensis TaxID=174633 RepID=A0A2C9CKD4_KUEST|nr:MULTISPECIES: amino acid ABC transporter ATP-binding protein [Kuenenia]MBZ0191590.1 amino acid ABC transporter ATP-binding protein [Candidatus Kuenenia stuttgartiensis]MCF6152184.1 amino acid ABC transporter ATP-binding protein [Candidatus Kuenenia stuttgartiensis]MCL4728017.1 amino acid ABC transporter ATP-binding protein [Candidatus Kuenenia stuttgartiensis]MCZ7623994.1 amino acid ABC transporter ATP-binding protein [Candidatus Kuenenia sp.]QII12231.1 glutamine transport ATP-binding prote
MIKIRDLTKQYDHEPLFTGFHLDIAKGDIVSIIGPSGSGKSTLLRCINGLECFQKGKISVDELTIYGTLEPDYRYKKNNGVVEDIRRKIGMVFQQFNLFPHMTVLHNVMVASVHVLGINHPEAESRAMGMLQRVCMEKKAKSYPGQLSGGEQQRVAIARALTMKPEAMLFDEPTSSLDPEMTDDVLAVIRELVSEGMTTVIATHEMHFAKSISRQVIFLEKGKIVESGSPEMVFCNPQNIRTREFLSHFTV